MNKELNNEQLQVLRTQSKHFMEMAKQISKTAFLFLEHKQGCELFKQELKHLGDVFDEANTHLGKPVRTAMLTILKNTICLFKVCYKLLYEFEKENPKNKDKKDIRKYFIDGVTILSLDLPFTNPDFQLSNNESKKQIVETEFKNLLEEIINNIESFKLTPSTLVDTCKLIEDRFVKTFDDEFVKTSMNEEGGTKPDLIKTDMSDLDLANNIKRKLAFFLFSGKTPEEFKQEMEKVFSKLSFSFKDSVTQKTLDTGQDETQQKQNQVEILTESFNFLHNYKLEYLYKAFISSNDEYSQKELTERIYAMISCIPMLSFSSMFFESADVMKKTLKICLNKISNAPLSEIDTTDNLEKIVMDAIEEAQKN